MANHTVRDAHSIHSTNPQYLVEKIIRTRIYESKYWKEECFGLTAELVVDKAMELKYVGGVYGGNIKPTPFLCLTLKLLQIQPKKDIIMDFIKNEDFKYVQMLGALYMRLTGTAIDCYKYLEPLYDDYRKIKEDEEEDEEDKKLKRILSPDHHRRGYRDLDKLCRSPVVQYRQSRSRSPRRHSCSRKRRRPSLCQERHHNKSPRWHQSRSQDRCQRPRSKSPAHHRSHRH
ncbi:PR38A factor, partial [Aphelocoma coerulescens]|nr:PR38A factor [Aphelocoma coerulescens]